MVKKVLIVDDEKAICKLLEKALKKVDVETVSANSAEEALEILEKEKILVMFIDLKLPGMNGIELCRIIKKSNPIACAYAMTGFSSLFDLADCREAGFEDYFIKPLDIKVFIKTAETAIEKLDRWKKK